MNAVPIVPNQVFLCDRNTNYFIIEYLAVVSQDTLFHLDFFSCYWYDPSIYMLKRILTKPVSSNVDIFPHIYYNWINNVNYMFINKTGLCKIYGIKIRACCLLFEYRYTYIFAHIVIILLTVLFLLSFLKIIYTMWFINSVYYV